MGRGEEDRHPGRTQVIKTKPRFRDPDLLIVIFRSLWKGWGPNVQRAAFVNLGDLTTYDTAKHLVLKHTNLKDDYLLHAMAR